MGVRTTTQCIWGRGKQKTMILLADVVLSLVGVLITYWPRGPSSGFGRPQTVSAHGDEP